MRNVTRLFWAVLLLMFSAVGISAEQDRDALAAELMQKSGLNQQIELIPAQVQAGIRDAARHGRPMDVVIQEKLISALDVEMLRHGLQRYVAEHMSVSEMKQVLAWVEAPLGKKIVEMEIAASKPSAMVGMFGVFEQEQKRVGRVERIARLDEALMSKERNKDLMLNMQVFFSLAVNAGSGSNYRASYAQTRNEMERVMSPMWGELDQFVSMVYLYTYQGLDDNDLDRYLEFNESQHGRSYNRVIFEGLGQTFIHAGKLLRSSLKSACRTGQDGCDGVHPYPLV